MAERYGLRMGEPKHVSPTHTYLLKQSSWSHLLAHSLNDPRCQASPIWVAGIKSLEPPLHLHYQEAGVRSWSQVLEPNTNPVLWYGTA